MLLLNKCDSFKTKTNFTKTYKQKFYSKDLDLKGMENLSQGKKAKNSNNKNLNN